MKYIIFSTILLIIAICCATAQDPKDGGYPQASKDTLNDYYKRSTGFKVYTYTYQGTKLPITGSNNTYNMLGSKFVFSGKAMIAGVLVAFERKFVRNGYDHCVKAYHLTGSGSLPSGNELGIGYFKVAAIDTSSSSPVWTYIPFKSDSTPVVTGNFAVLVQTRLGYTTDDTLTIYSNLVGNGQQEHTACDLWYTSKTTYSSEDLYDTPATMDEGGKPDFDLMIFPVIDYTLDVGEECSLNGLSCRITSLMPVKDKLSLEISTDGTSTADIQLLDMNGRLINEIKGVNIAGSTETVLDISGCASGTYIFIVRTGAGTLSGKFPHE